MKNPVYAGVYAYGRRREKTVLVDGQIRRVRPDTRDPERWLVKIEGAHPGYITWERYGQNQEKLRQNMTRMGDPSRGLAFLYWAPHRSARRAPADFYGAGVFRAGTQSSLGVVAVSCCGPNWLPTKIGLMAVNFGEPFEGTAP